MELFGRFGGIFLRGLEFFGILGEVFWNWGGGGQNKLQNQFTFY